MTPGFQFLMIALDERRIGGCLRATALTRVAEEIGLVLICQCELGRKEGVVFSPSDV